MASRALVSDIHANLEALTTVLADIDARRITDIICLGDIVGYGPSPEECIDRVAARCRITLMGNHDYALLHGPAGFSRVAAAAIYCTQDLMFKHCLNVELTKRRAEFLKNLPDEAREGRCLYVHASPRDHLSEYLMEQDVEFGPDEKVVACFALIEQLCFVGHTHRPGIMTLAGPFLRPTGKESRIPIPGEKAIINVGSVGQPRDGDPRACYCEVTDTELVFHRLEYDIATTQAKIGKLGCLDNRCATRLALGR
ncbi:MAG: metallophosphoesterase family protein [Planctomycetota bacterium]|nr:metallophosphoesterase family protein [Planctomycetota bacterium]